MQAELRDRCGHRLCAVIPAKAGIQYSAATLGLLGRPLSRVMTRLGMRAARRRRPGRKHSGSAARGFRRSEGVHTRPSRRVSLRIAAGLLAITVACMAAARYA